MRICCYILSLFLFALTAMPCADTDQDLPVQTTTTISGTEHQQHDHNAYGDGCSPFCVCQCCHAHVIIKNSFPAIGNFTTRTDYSDNNIGPVPAPFFVIWQPPKA